jgi:hypothetical protein
VIDASSYKKALARYANDARGLKRVKGIQNNCVYVYRKDKDAVFIESTRDIPPNSEILVNYGKEYWDVIRYNAKLSAKELKESKVKPGKKKKSANKQDA